MDVGVICQQAFAVCVVEVGSVVDRGLFGWSTTKDLRLPCIAGKWSVIRFVVTFVEEYKSGKRHLQMTVEVNDADRPVCAVHTAKKGKRNGVITAERNDAWESLSLLRGSSCMGVRGRSAREKRIVTLFDLFEGVGIVISVLEIVSKTQRRMRGCRTR